MICTIADRCDLKGLTINERLERVAETLDKILESWAPKSSDTPTRSPGAVKLSRLGIHEDIDELSPKENRYSRQCSEDTLDVMHEPDNALIMEELNVLSEISYEARSPLTADLDTKTSSAGSLTPRSPLLTPRTSQIELLLSRRRTMTELENNQQVRF